MSRPKRRRLGQHFLVDRGVANSIVHLLDDQPQQVVEIGPGRGALTGPLLERFERVLALEVDAEIIPDLGRQFAGSSLELRLGDALIEPLDGLLGSEGPWQLASNLPYSVGTAILRRLLPRHDLLTRLVVMLQREVALRVAARPGDRNHGLLALERAAHAAVRVAFDVQPASFRPRPRVVSTVLVLDLAPPRYEAVELGKALTLAGRALTRPRKTLRNALAPWPDAAALTRAGLDPGVRPATVDLEAWLRLAAAGGIDS